MSERTVIPVNSQDRLKHSKRISLYLYYRYMDMEKKYCQSCGMPLDKEEWLGTDAHGGRSTEYCHYCLQKGEYTVDYTLEKMVETWVKYSEEFNRYCNTNLTKAEIEALLKERLPALKRWRPKDETTDAYHKSLNQVTEYINEHLFEDLDLDTLSQVANLSEFHFHRIFRALTGENIGGYIQRIRLEYVAHKLRFTLLSVSQIAGITSFRSIYSLSRAFKKHFGVTPTAYRKQELNITTGVSRESPEQLDIIPARVRLEKQQMVYINIRKAFLNPSAYKAVWQKLTEFSSGRQLIQSGSKYVSISFDDPTITPLSQCRYYIGITTNAVIKPQKQFGVMFIPDGKYAVFRFKGEYSLLYKLYAYIHLQWLPHSGCRLRNTLSFEVYINTPQETLPAELLTDVYIPVE